MLLVVWTSMLFGALGCSTGHLVYPPLDSPRFTRHSIEDWRPLNDEGPLKISSRHAMRYSPPPPPPPPHYHKSQFLPPPPRHIKNHGHQQMTAEHSENIEVFSSAPPSILGSLSVFGHATVNAREPASRITKKSPRPQDQVDGPFSYRHPLQGPLNHHPIHDYHKPHLPFFQQTFEDRPYNLYDPSLRPPPRDHDLGLIPHPHSSSLTPNSYFFETPQPFQSNNPDLGLKHRKPIYKHQITHNPYRLPSPPLYSTLNDQFKTPTQSPLNFENENLSFDRGINNKLNKNNVHLGKPNLGNLNFYSRNPFGDIRLSTRRPEPNLKYSDKTNGKDVFEQYSHLGRPFQSSTFIPSSGIQNHKEIDTYKPFVTTFSSVTRNPSSVKYSDQQFNSGDSIDVVPSSKPDYVVTHHPFGDEVLPITVTTIDIPTDPIAGTGKPVKEPFVDDIFQPTKSTWELSNKKTYDGNGKIRHQLHINSYEHDPLEHQFLPTPSSFPVSFLDEKNNRDTIADNNNSSRLINEEYSPNKGIEDTTEYFTTEMPETTTRFRSYYKNRRRPANKPETTTRVSDSDDITKTHRQNNDHKRRRKPSYSNRGSNNFDRNRNSELKKHRTTTTTEVPEVYEPTVYNEFTTIPATDEAVTFPQFLTTDTSLIEEYEINQDKIHYIEEDPMNEVRTPNTESIKIFHDEVLVTAGPPTASTPAVTYAVTTTPYPTPRNEISSTAAGPTSSSNRLKSKYGNRPRFSVKDYRDRLTRVSSTTLPPEEISERTKTMPKETNLTKNIIRNRGTSQYKTSTESTVESTDSKRKYKPRVGPSRYRTTTTTTQASVILESPTTPATTDRINTFRPSTNRYKPGTGKYYSRYRTSTGSPMEADDSNQASNKVIVRPKGVFSAKRRPFPLKTRFESSSDDTEMNQDEITHSIQKDLNTIRNSENEVAPSTLITKKIDNESTTTSSEEKSSESDLSILDPISDPTGMEAMRIADLTSSSSNDFKSSGFSKTISPSSSRRNIPKISLPVEEPILPLEAFFQTHSNKDK